MSRKVDRRRTVLGYVERGRGRLHAELLFSPSGRYVGSLTEARGGVKLTQQPFGGISVRSRQRPPHRVDAQLGSERGAMPKRFHDGSANGRYREGFRMPAGRVPAKNGCPPV